MRVSLFIIVALSLAGCSLFGGKKEPEPPPAKGPEIIAPEPTAEDEEKAQVRWLDDRGQWQEVESGEVRSGDAVPAEAWVAEDNAIRIYFKPVDTLNLYRGNPSTVLVKVFQASDPNGLKQLLSQEDGMRILLTREQPDPTIVRVNQFIIEPGQEKLVQLERAATARYVAVVAGYFKLDAATASRFVAVPGLEPSISRWRRLGRALNPFSDDLPPEPAHVAMWLHMGETGFDKVQIRAE